MMCIKGTYLRWLLLGLFCMPFGVLAQENCTQKLRTARNYYQEGKLDLLPDLLKGCLSNGFNKEEKIEALRLVTLSHLYSENEAQALVSYLSLLNIEPEFVPSAAADPTELLLLAEKFDTDPKFFWGVILGAGYSLVEVITPTLSINTSLQPGDYSFSTTIGGGLFFQYPINDKFSANAEVYYMQRTLNLNKESLEQSEQDFTQTITEQQSWLEVPILLNYELYKKPFLIEATGGLSFHYLMEANLSSEGVGTAINNVDKLDRRNIFNMSAIIGARANFKMANKLFITTALLYQHRLFNEVNYPSNYNYTQLEESHIYNSNYADGEFKGHTIWLKLGVRIPYYKPALK